jgi:hypothetical protein
MGASENSFMHLPVKKMFLRVLQKNVLALSDGRI